MNKQKNLNKNETKFCRKSPILPSKIVPQDILRLKGVAKLGRTRLFVVIMVDCFFSLASLVKYLFLTNMFFCPDDLVGGTRGFRSHMLQFLIPVYAAFFTFSTAKFTNYLFSEQICTSVTIFSNDALNIDLPKLFSNSENFHPPLSMLSYTSDLFSKACLF